MGSSPVKFKKDNVCVDSFNLVQTRRQKSTFFDPPKTSEYCFTALTNSPSFIKSTKEEGESTEKLLAGCSIRNLNFREPGQSDKEKSNVAEQIDLNGTYTDKTMSESQLGLMLEALADDTD